MFWTSCSEILIYRWKDFVMDSVCKVAQTSSVQTFLVTVCDQLILMSQISMSDGKICFVLRWQSFKIVRVVSNVIGPSWASPFHSNSLAQNCLLVETFLLSVLCSLSSHLDLQPQLVRGNLHTEGCLGSPAVIITPDVHKSHLQQHLTEGDGGA